MQIGVVLHTLLYKIEYIVAIRVENDYHFLSQYNLRVWTVYTYYTDSKNPRCDNSFRSNIIFNPSY